MLRWPFAPPDVCPRPVAKTIDEARCQGGRGWPPSAPGVGRLREEIEAKLRAWSKTLDTSKVKGEGAGTTAKTLVERIHGAIQTQLRELRPLIGDLRDRAVQAEKEAKRLVKEWRAKREPARAALGELKTGAERAWRGGGPR